MTTYTLEDLDYAERDDRWLGFGYLGERRHARDTTDPECIKDPAKLAAADKALMVHISSLGWSYEQLFQWLNSKFGRWTAESLYDHLDNPTLGLDRAAKYIRPLTDEDY